MLESLKDKKRYIGFTTDLKRRFEEHQEGYSKATQSRLPMNLIYFEVCTNEDGARRREEYFKTIKGRRFLAKRLKSYYKSKL